MLDKSVIQRWIKVLSNVRQECCPTLDKGLFNVGNKLFQISENSGVKYYAIVLSNV